MGGVDLETARRVLAEHQDSILAQVPGAVGIGIGAADGEGHAIVVLLERVEHLPDEPRQVTGVPLRFEVTGPFTAQ